MATGRGGQAQRGQATQTTPVPADARGRTRGDGKTAPRVPVQSDAPAFTAHRSFALEERGLARRSSAEGRTGSRAMRS